MISDNQKQLVDAPRIVCLLPSATEIVHGLGLTSSIVGRSHECDFPSEIRSVPEITFAHVDSTAPSDRIDEDVKNRLSKGLSLYGIHEHLLREARPDFIVTQTQCDVCAVSLADVQKFVAQDLGIDAEVLVLEPSILNEVWQDIRNVSQAIGVIETGETLVDSLKARLETIYQRTASLPRPRVAMIEWTAPMMAAGNWVPELVDIAGGQNLLGTTGQHSDWLTEDQLVAADPDYIIVTPCGFDLARTKKEMLALAKLPSWADLRAVQEGKVYAVDGNAYFNRPGPRLVESAEILAEILHPTEFSFGHADDAWERFVPGLKL